jgi:hypothetical protein
VDAGDSNPLFRFAKSVYHTMCPKSGVAPMRRLLHRLKVKNKNYGINRTSRLGIRRAPTADEKNKPNQFLEI